jgi:peptidoglycan-associated lipoprotein
MKKLMMSIVLVNLLAACASEAPIETPADTKPESAAAAPADQTADAAKAEADANAAAIAQAQADADAAAAKAKQADAEAAALRAQAERDAAAAAAAKNSVFFPFDADVVQEADKAVILTQAKKLAQNPNMKVRVEGNADERGSSEYNLALGQRRAKSTKKALQLAGAKATQIATISYGEEKPRATGHDESSWSQNRRADIVAGK